MRYSLFWALVCSLLVCATSATAQIQLTFSFDEPACNGYTNGTATVNATGGTTPYVYQWENGQTGQTNMGIGAGTFTVTVSDAAGISATGSVTVTQPTALVANIQGSNIGCDANSGTLEATQAGGTAPYTWAWSNLQNTAVIQVAGAGNYVVTVTDANGCTDEATFVVPPPISVDVAVTNIPCFTDTNGGAAYAIVTNGVGPFNFLWNNNTTDPSLQGLPVGTYSVTVTDANACTASDAGTVSSPPPMEVEAVAIIPSCGSANSGSATIVATGGVPPYTHTWTPGGYTGATVSGLAPGQYYVCTFDANHCQKDLWVIIPEISSLNVTLQVVSAECTGIDDGVVTAFVNPPGNYEYQWNIPPFHGVTQLMGLPVGTFVAVTVTDPVTGCSGTASVTVGAHNAIHVDVVDTDVICAGQNDGTAVATASGGTPLYQYVWLTPPTGPVIGNTAAITGLAPGAYMVSVTDSRGCTAIGVADIGLDSAPEAIIDGLDVVVCGDSTSQVQFTSLSVDPLDTIASWVWTITTTAGVQTFSNVNPLLLDLPVGLSGTAQLVITSTAGCNDTASVAFIVPGIPDISLSPDSITVDCNNAPIHLEVTGGQPWYVYTWSPLTGLTLDSIPPNATVDPDVTTQYQLVANDQGCTDTVRVVVIRVDSINLYVADDIVETCDSLYTLFVDSKIQNLIWINAQGDTIGGNPVTVVAGETTIYTAIATNAFGCKDSVTVSVTGVGLDVDLDPDIPDSICEGDTIQLGVINHHPGDTLTYAWSSVPPLNFETASSSNPTVTGGAGDYLITVIVTNQFDCTDTLSFPLHIEPKDSLANHITVDLCDGKIVSFFNASGLPGVWDFGDSNTSQEQNPVHTYAAAGDYQVSFTPFDSTCVIPWDSLIHVLDTTLGPTSITYEYLNCIDSTVIQFFGSSNGAVISWNWSFEGGVPDTSSLQNPIVVFHEPGVFDITLVVADINGCTDTAHIVLNIAPKDSLENDIVIDLCDGKTVSFFNLSGIPGTWNFGDNSTSVEQNPVHVYTAAGDYLVTFTVADSLCIMPWDSLIHVQDTTLGPTMIIYEYINCIDSTEIQFFGQSNGVVVHWNWSFEGGVPDTSSLQNPIVVFHESGVFNVTLVVEDINGCTDTAHLVLNIAPKDSLENDIVIDLCDGKTVSFFNLSGIAGTWNFGDNNTSVEQNPVHVYAEAGDYLVTFTAPDSLCIMPWDSLIHVQDTTLGPTSITYEYINCIDSTEIQFFSHTNGVAVAWAWSFEGAVPDTSNLQNPIVVYHETGSFDITLVVLDTNGCTDTARITLFIAPKDSLENDIEIDLCDGKTVSFFNNSGVAGTWNFGDNSTSTDQNPVHVYADAGAYLVTFMPPDSLCIMPWDSLIQVQDTALAIPVITHEYLTCIDSAQIQFFGSSNGNIITWAWGLEGAVPDTSNLQNPVVVYHEEGTYTVTLVVTDVNGCTNSDTIDIEVFILMDTIDWEVQTCIDSVFHLNPNGVDSTATYLWSAVPPDPTLVPTDKNPAVHPLVSTTYSVTITEGTLCSKTGEVRIIFLQAPNLEVPNDTVVCNDDPLVITVTGSGISYEWSDSLDFNPVFDNDATTVITPIKNGIYYIRVTSIDGCVAIDSIKINNGSLDMGGPEWDAELCLGEETQLIVTNLDPDDILTYTWTPSLPNVGNPTVAPETDTSYHVVFENQFGCKDSLDFGIKVNWVTVDATVTGKDTICPGLTTTLLATPAGNGPPFSFLWSPGGSLSDETIADPIANPDGEQIYVVTVTDEMGCTATDEVTIYYISGQCVEPYIFVPKAFTPNNDANNDFFIVRGVNITELQFIVWDRWGEKVYETSDPRATGWDGTFNGKELTPDSYAWYLRARCGNGAVYESKGDVTLLK